MENITDKIAGRACYIPNCYEINFSFEIIKQISDMIKMDIKTIEGSAVKEIYDIR